MPLKAQTTWRSCVHPKRATCPHRSAKTPSCPCRSAKARSRFTKRVVTRLRDNKERLTFLYRIGDEVLERGALIAIPKDQMLGKRFVLVAVAGREAHQGFTLVLRLGYAFRDIVVRDRGVMVKW